MTAKNLKLTAHMVTPVAQHLPHLDGLLEIVKARTIDQDNNTPSRMAPAPPMGSIPIPVERKRVMCDGNEWQIACCSSPILSVETQEGLEYVNKRLDVGEVGHHMAGKRMSIHYGSGATKAYHKPVKIWIAPRIHWFVKAFGEKRGPSGGNRRRSPEASLRRYTQLINVIGGYRGQGYGRVGRWEIDEIDDDWSWYSSSEDGPVLMRPLPLGLLDDQAVGWRRARGACCPPYWHPDRVTDVAVPV